MEDITSDIELLILAIEKLYSERNWSYLGESVDSLDYIFDMNEDLQTQYREIYDANAEIQVNIIFIIRAINNILDIVGDVTDGQYAHIFDPLATNWKFDQIIDESFNLGNYNSDHDIQRDISEYFIKFRDYDRQIKKYVKVLVNSWEQ